jgi:hypothetical protein
LSRLFQPFRKKDAFQFQLPGHAADETTKIRRGRRPEERKITLSGPQERSWENVPLVQPTWGSGPKMV